MAKKSKTKTEEVFTPHDLDELHEQTRKLLGRNNATQEAEETVAAGAAISKVFITILTILTALLILWLVSLFITLYGDLVISTDNSLRENGIVLSADKDFKTTAIQLSAPKAVNVTNIAYEWLPQNLDETDGSHNGDNYLAYTFYLKNGGQKTLDYTGTMEITGSAKGMDEAIRIMIYKNGEPLIYAKGKKSDRSQAEKGTIAWLDDTTVMKTQTKDFAPAAVDKYTVVIWLEGNDSECVNDILGGYIRSRILFSVADSGEGTDRVYS